MEKDHSFKMSELALIAKGGEHLAFEVQSGPYERYILKISYQKSHDTKHVFSNDDDVRREIGCQLWDLYRSMPEFDMFDQLKFERRIPKQNLPVSDLEARFPDFVFGNSIGILSLNYYHEEFPELKDHRSFTLEIKPKYLIDLDVTSKDVQVAGKLLGSDERALSIRKGDLFKPNYSTKIPKDMVEDFNFSNREFLVNNFEALTRVRNLFLRRFVDGKLVTMSLTELSSYLEKDPEILRHALIDIFQKKEEADPSSLSILEFLAKIQRQYNSFYFRIFPYLDLIADQQLNISKEDIGDILNQLRGRVTSGDSYDIDRLDETLSAFISSLQRKNKESGPNVDSTPDPSPKEAQKALLSGLISSLISGAFADCTILIKFKAFEIDEPGMNDKQGWRKISFLEKPTYVSTNIIDINMKLFWKVFLYGQRELETFSPKLKGNQTEK